MKLRILFLLMIVASFVLLSGCTKMSDKKVLSDTYHQMVKEYNSLYTINFTSKTKDNKKSDFTTTISMDMQSETKGFIYIYI